MGLLLGLPFGSVPLAQGTTGVTAKIKDSGKVEVKGKATANARIFWEGEFVTQANKKGSFSFKTTEIPDDCVGEVTENENTVSVSVAKCKPGWRPRDVIMLFDDHEVETQATNLQQSFSLTANPSALTDFKAQQYSSLKQGVNLLLGSGGTNFQKGQQIGASLVQDYSHLPVMTVHVDTPEALKALANRPEVRGIYKTKKYRLALKQSLEQIKLPPPESRDPLWKGTGTTVAVIDSGVDYTNPSFGSCSNNKVFTPGANCKIAAALDVWAAGLMVGDDTGQGHGTHVAGIVLGVAPDTRIIDLDVGIGLDGPMEDVHILAAINWAVRRQAEYNIVAMNMSLGKEMEKSNQCDKSSRLICSGSLCSIIEPIVNPVDWYENQIEDIYEVLFARARAIGIAPVVASGNEGKWLDMPACIRGAVSVGAVYDADIGSSVWPDAGCTDKTTARDQVACGSNSALGLSLLAPGEWIDAAGIGGGGTSMAAPHVAGAWAVLRSLVPNAGVTSILHALRKTGVLLQDSRTKITTPRLEIDLDTLNVLRAHPGVNVNGQACQIDADCQSGACYPGPGYGTENYCMADEQHCAWPGENGFAEGAVRSWEGYRVRCMNPAPGSRARFAYYDGEPGLPIGNLFNGDECKQDSDCRSGSCYPGPGYGDPKYCMAKNRNCAWPDSDGFMYGAELSFEGYPVRCMDPGSGSRSRFAYYAGEPGPIVGGRNNGESCQQDKDCRSSYCYPGPGYGTDNYCIAAEKNCAWPGTNGYMYGTTATWEGFPVRCMDPGSGSIARFAFEINPPPPGANGALCQKDSDCSSGSCYPGPGNGDVGYCIARSSNCAWPGSNGYMGGTIKTWEGRAVKCMIPAPGSRWRFAYY